MELLGPHRFWKETQSFLDADSGPVRGSVAQISQGNGSPSAHPAPSSKYSFFQIGTVFFKVSMIQRQASKATPRWADDTTISTEVSPISMRPSLCRSLTSRILNCSSDC